MPRHTVTACRVFFGAALASPCASLALALTLAGPAFAQEPATEPPQADPTYLPELLARAQAKDLAHTRPWQVLLHYQRTALGGYRSEADGLGFFNAGRGGKRDPERELEATLRAFFSTTAPAPGLDEEARQHPMCRFPARLAWLRQALDVDPARLPNRACPLYQRWRQAFSANAVTLVFASAYLNSPASMYGHTFLRLSRSTGEGNALLDYIINFAADVDTDNGLVYAWKGVTGGFPGHFYTMPYYVKVQEYTHMESRDLWEYDLGFTPGQAERLVQHTWETRSTHFDYFFFTENCSYHLLALIEAANPDLHLTDGFGGRVIPADTVRAILDQTSARGHRLGRPSLATLMKRRRGELDGHEIELAEGLANHGQAAVAGVWPSLAPARQAAVADAAYDYFRFREGATATPSNDSKRRERDILVLRGRSGVPPQAIDGTPGVAAPEDGHRTLKLALGAGYVPPTDRRGGAAGAPASGHGAFIDLAARPAIHDLYDPADSYAADAALTMLGVRLRFRPGEANVGRALALQRLDALDILSLAPLDRWVRSLSWKVWAGGAQARERGCEGWTCLVWGVRAGGGGALRAGSPRWGVMGWGLFQSALDAGQPLDGVAHARAGFGVHGGVLAGLGAHARLGVEGEGLGFVLGDRHAVLHTTLTAAFRLSEGAELRLGAALDKQWRGLAPQTTRPDGPPTPAPAPHAEASLTLAGWF